MEGSRMIKFSQSQFCIFEIPGLDHDIITNIN
jgi:hypothetical protein